MAFKFQNYCLTSDMSSVVDLDPTISINMENIQEKLDWVAPQMVGNEGKSN